MNYWKKIVCTAVVFGIVANVYSIKPLQEPKDDIDPHNWVDYLTFVQNEAPVAYKKNKVFSKVVNMVRSANEAKNTNMREYYLHQAYDIAEEESLNDSNSWGQFLIGYFYEVGIYVKENPEKAFSWISSSAEQNNAEAQYWMGRYYMDEESGAPGLDFEKALYYLKQSAVQGQPHAVKLLQYLFIVGKAPVSHLQATKKITQDEISQALTKAQESYNGYKNSEGQTLKPDPEAAYKALDGIIPETVAVEGLGSKGDGQ